MFQFMKRLVEDKKPTSRFIVLLSVVFICQGYFIVTSGASYGSIGAPPSLGEVVPDKMIYVNNQHPDASDSNKGDQNDAPVKTMGNAAEMAMRNQEKGFSTKIIIYPGTYREQIKLDFRSRKRSPPIIFEAKDPGTVVVSGSDIWTNWEVSGRNGMYVHPWPHKWGYMAGPSQLSEKFKPIVRRREMIFLNGAPLEQVLSAADLKQGTFYISEDDSKVYLSPPSGQILSNTLVEVAIRSDIFDVTRGENIIVRGLTFQHDTTGMSTLGSAVHFKHSNNILIEDCEISWNNWFGLRFTQVNNVTTRRNRANHNGGAGWVGWKIKDLLSEGDETSYNNWRGVKGNFLGWEIAGLKHHAVHDAIYRNYKAMGNQTRGFWLDYDNERIQIEEACICENLMAGINLEASQGPISIKNSRICKNQNHGISSDSSRVGLEGNHIYGNNASQIKHTFGNDRPVNSWETGAKLKIHGNNMSLKNNVIAVDSNAVLLELSGEERLISDLVLEGNLWYKTNGKDLFKVGRKVMDAPEWQAVTSQGQKSSYTDPIKLGINLHDASCY